MSQTVTAAVAYIKEDFSDVSDNAVLAVMQEVVDDFCPLYPLYTSVRTFTSLVAGTSEYNFTTVPASVRAARYITASGDIGQVLRPVSIDELDMLQPLWRGYQRTTPNAFYVTSDGTNVKLGLSPAPVVSSSGGYPYVEVPTWDYALLAFNSATGYVTSLPTQVVSSRAITAETKARLAVRVKDPNAMTYLALAQQAVRSLHLQTLGQSVQAKQLLLSDSQLRTSRRV